MITPSRINDAALADRGHGPIIGRWSSWNMTLRCDPGGLLKSNPNATAIKQTRGHELDIHIDPWPVNIFFHNTMDAMVYNEQ